MNKRERKSHKVRAIRLSEEVYEWLKAIKAGTWNQTFKKILDEYGEDENRPNKIQN